MSKKPVGLKDFKTEMVPIGELIPYLQNPKAHPAGQVDKIASSIKNFGFLVPLVVDSGNEIIAGHGRLLAAQKLGLGVVPCVRADNLTPAEIKAFRIMDNKSQESEWFPETLALELKALEEMAFDLGLTGFDLDELERLTGAFDIAGADEPKLRSGDRAPFQEMTFTVHDEQAEEIKAAINKAKKAGCQSAVNENSNGNALAFICQEFLRG